MAVGGIDAPALDYSSRRVDTFRLPSSLYTVRMYYISLVFVMEFKVEFVGPN